MEGKEGRVGAAVGGPLQLKGISLIKSSKRKKKHKKKKHKKKHKKKKDRSESDGSETDSETDDVPQPEIPVRRSGSGKVISSSTTIHGSHGSKFMSELSNGDVLIVKHPTSLVEEIRVITMVLSDVSLSISSAFSSDLITATSFDYMKKPKAKGGKKRKRKSAAEMEEEEKLAFGTYASKGNRITYRVRKGGKNASGGYTIVTETVGSGEEPPSREFLMNLRAKKKSDRYCM